ncbi:MAG: MgtC/SapB family protein [Gammaproteobacteria bacterium]|nr:MgtC/SapB family protein [Gammaproteobacteria bacterium]
MGSLEPFYALGMALALGLLIGLERGWHERDLGEGQRVAGIRTFALIGLLGGAVALLTPHFGIGLPAVAFVTLAGVLLVAYVLRQQRIHDAGVTSIIAALLTFTFGVMAVLGHELLAATGAVVTVILLGSKPLLHDWVARLRAEELYATFRLLLISVVVLPLLPDRGFGPWQALNPYRIWWMVVLISGISFAGYVALRIAGERRGVLATGLFAGLASSTAVTVSLARRSRDAVPADLLAAGIIIACATMFLRILVVASIVRWPLAAALAGPLLLMGGVSFLAAWFYWRRGGSGGGDGMNVRNPFELRPALIFAGLLALVMLLSAALVDRFGAASVHGLAAAAGLADVDAITLSLAGMAGRELALSTAAAAILLAAVVNSLVKSALALGIGGRALGLRVGAALLIAVLAGLAGLVVMGR